MISNYPSHDILSTLYTNWWSEWYMVDKKWVNCTVFNIVHHKSFKWLNLDSYVDHVTQCELGRRHSRLMSLGQWIIDTMVGMNKDYSSEYLGPKWRFDQLLFMFIFLDISQWEVQRFKEHIAIIPPPQPFDFKKWFHWSSCNHLQFL